MTDKYFKVKFYREECRRWSAPFWFQRGYEARMAAATPAVKEENNYRLTFLAQGITLSTLWDSAKSTLMNVFTL